MMKQLAAKADERWNSIPSFLDAPEKQQPAPAVAVSDSEGPTKAQTEAGGFPGVKSAVGDQEEVASASETSRTQETGRQRNQEKEKEPNPWQKAGSTGRGMAACELDAWSCAEKMNSRFNMNKAILSSYSAQKSLKITHLQNFIAGQACWQCSVYFRLCLKTGLHSFTSV